MAWRLSTMAWIWVVLAGLAGCNAPPRSQVPLDQGLERSADRSAAEGAPPPPCGGCPPGYACQLGTCVLQQGACTSDDQCQNDTYCDKGNCSPYGSGRNVDDSCAVGVAPFQAEAFEQPELRCSWSGGPVIMTPVVADLDGDRLPEIIVTNFDSGNLVVLDGRTCAVKLDVTAFLETGAQLAVADLEGDQTPEIVGIKPDNRVVVMTAAGVVLATSDEPAQVTFTKQPKFNGGPAIANLDGQGVAEIVYGGMALRLEQGKLVTLYNVPVSGGDWGILSAVADVDLDGKPEVVVGQTILNGQTGADKSPPGVKGAGGYPAIAQFDATPEPEIVFFSSASLGKGEQLRIYNPITGAIVFGPMLGPYAYGTWGGPPTVADFDGDGAPEVGVAGPQQYTVYDPGCTEPLPPGCSKVGIRWQKKSLDTSSGSTGSSVFDFNGDGRAEVIYRDECWLRVYDGETGKVRFAYSASSLTLLDYPVVADLDNDGHADLIVPSSNYVPCADEPELQLKAGSQTKGVMVLQDPKNRWMPSRGVWNQHTYHITNINDDLTVPLQEAASWKSYNSYRQNVQGKGAGTAVPGPDLTAGLVKQPDEPLPDCRNGWPLYASVCNRGAARVVRGVVGTFFVGDPDEGGQPICSVTTSSEIPAGGCVVVTCTYPAPPAGEIDLWFVADRRSDGKSSVAECKEGNNKLHLPGARCLGLE